MKQIHLTKKAITLLIIFRLNMKLGRGLKPSLAAMETLDSTVERSPAPPIMHWQHAKHSPKFEPIDTTVHNPRQLAMMTTGGGGSSSNNSGFGNRRSPTGLLREASQTGSLPHLRNQAAPPQAGKGNKVGGDMAAYRQRRK